MAERVRFHFDPLCPWAWQSSKWIREVENVRDIEVEWRFFSLQIINSEGDDPLRDRHAKGTPVLRTLALVKREEGNEAVDRLYQAIGKRVHDGDEPLGLEAAAASLADCGMEESLVDRALEDESTIEDVRRDHEEAVTQVGAFGVPTMIFSSGRGIFGPVISTPPGGEESGRLYDHVRALAEMETFFELKRDRDRGPGE